MRDHRLALIIALLIFLAAFKLAWGETPPELLRAFTFSEEGQPRAAVAILEPMLRGDTQQLSDADRGFAWMLLGTSYKDVEAYDKARHCFETAIHILDKLPNTQSLYASATDNLGTVEDAEGHLDLSKALRIKARRLYMASGNHAGVAVTSSNLALVDLKQGDGHGARKELDEAFREAQLAQNHLSENDLATMYTVKGALARDERDYRTAVEANQQAIEIWTRSHGPHFFMLGTAYALRGEAAGRLGEHEQAVADLRHALELLAETPGRGAPAYLTVELAYAHALRDSGSKLEAARLEKEANAGLASVRVQQCGGCTISAESFR